MALSYTKVFNILRTALKYQEQHIPYKFGANFERDRAFDCSELMQQIYGENGIALPRSSRDQAKVGYPVDRPLPGDLVIIDRTGEGVPDHVGMDIGDGLMVHIANSEESVNICRYDVRYKGKIHSFVRVQ